MGQRVLIIDDSPMVQSLVRTALAADGLEVLSSLDGRTGIDLASVQRPDLILLDVTMPGMDGYEVCEILQVQPETSGIPIIFLSAADSTQDRIRGLEHGANDYITKPFSDQELRARVRVSLRFRSLLDIESRRAMRDVLTGLWNRRYLHERLRGEVAACQRHKRSMSAIMIDIDHFKVVNDTRGHLVGDDVIRVVADTINRCCRQDDVACRYGGEEFTVLCPGVSASSAAILAERIRREIAALFIPNLPQITVSMGVGQFKDTAEGMLKEADASLYMAKQTGRNRVCVASRNAA